MNAYLPTNPNIAWSLAALLAAVLTAGFGITRLRCTIVARLAAWLLVAVALFAAERITASQGAGLRMLAIVAALLWSLKAVVTVEEQAAGEARLGPTSWWLFALGWFGMRPARFAGAPGPPLTGGRELIVRGVVRLLAGAVLVALARTFWVYSADQWPDGWRLLATSALLLPGLSLVLHFGIFNVLAGQWRNVGADCRALFRAPLQSTSLTEFWSRRWNLAFFEMAALCVFRPLRELTGARLATGAVFLFSGLLHELAISVPVRAGFGRPLLYFVLHGVAVLFEKSLDRAGCPIDRSAWLGRLWTGAWILLPLPLLFHPAFIRGCLFPLIAIGP